VAVAALVFRFVQTKVVTVRYDSETLLHNRVTNAVTIRNPDGVPQFQRIGLETPSMARVRPGPVSLPPGSPSGQVASNRS